MVAGCAMPLTAPVYGGVYTQVKGPVCVGDLSVTPTKQGVAEAQAIICVGTGDASIQAAMEKAIAYSKERRQFGKPISAFQAIRFKESR
jgi:hypothetical protein